MDNAENLSTEPAEKKPLSFEKKLGVIFGGILLAAAAAIGSKYIDGNPVVAQEPVQAVQPAQPPTPSGTPFSAPQQ